MKLLAIVALMFALVNCLKSVDAKLNVDNRGDLIVGSPFRLQELVDFAKNSEIVDKLRDYTDKQEQWMQNVENALKETEENKLNIMENPLTCLQYLSKQSYRSPRQMEDTETGSLVSVKDFLEKFAGSLASNQDLQATAKGDFFYQTGRTTTYNIISVIRETRPYPEKDRCF